MLKPKKGSYYLVQVYGYNEKRPREWRAKNKKALVGILKLVIDNVRFSWIDTSRIEPNMDRKAQAKT